jgi:hypothetical protein
MGEADWLLFSIEVLLQGRCIELIGLSDCSIRSGAKQCN